MKLCDYRVNLHGKVTTGAKQESEELELEGEDGYKSHWLLLAVLGRPFVHD